MIYYCTTCKKKVAEHNIIRGRPAEKEPYCNSSIHCNICNDSKCSVFSCFDIVKIKRMEFMPIQGIYKDVYKKILWVQNRKILQSACKKCNHKFICYTDGNL